MPSCLTCRRSTPAGSSVQRPPAMTNSLGDAESPTAAAVGLFNASLQLWECGACEDGLVPTPPAAVATAATAVAARAGALPAAIAIRAVDRPVATRLERHLSLLAAGAAGNGEHLALAGIAAIAAARAAVSLGAPRSSTVWTAPRLIREAAFLMVLLISSAEGKGFAAIGAGKGFVSEIHPTTSNEECIAQRSSSVHGAGPVEQTVHDALSAYSLLPF
jgi:hypothetical protein